MNCLFMLFVHVSTRVSFCHIYIKLPVKKIPACRVPGSWTAGWDSICLSLSWWESSARPAFRMYNFSCWLRSRSKSTCPMEQKNWVRTRYPAHVLFTMRAISTTGKQWRGFQEWTDYQQLWPLTPRSPSFSTLDIYLNVLNWRLEPRKHLMPSLNVSQITEISTKHK